MKIYVDANEKTRLERRIERDGKERGIKPKEVLYQWKKYVTPSTDK